MKTQLFVGVIAKRLLLATAASIFSFLSGCAAINQHLAGLSDAVLIHVQEKRELADIRHDTREALAEQREEARRIAAERTINEAQIAAERERLELEFCQANQEALHRRVKENIRQTVESKVAFNIEHAMEVGELEVDVEALKKVIEQREQEAQITPPPVKPSCPCCDRPCGCGQGVIRRHCPRCCHKPCEAEKKCGGPEMLTRLEQEAVRRPLRPTEIPMKLPVRLTFGFQQPEMEAARIRRVPHEAITRPCDRCPGGNCQCDSPCTQRMPDVTIEEENATTPVSDVPPLPEPDLEARLMPERQQGWPVEVSPQTKLPAVGQIFASNPKMRIAPTKAVSLKR